MRYPYGSARQGRVCPAGDRGDGKIPRHEFVPLELQAYAYLNSPLPVGYGKTISQPFIVALMTDLLEPQPGDVTLESVPALAIRPRSSRNW